VRKVKSESARLDQRVSHKHQSLTLDIVDRVFAAYATDLGRIDEFIDETDRWKIRWQQNIDKPERLIAVLNATNVDLYPSIHLNSLKTLSISTGVCLCTCIRDKLDNLSSPIVDLR
jgi:hypothetical protein